MKLGTYSIELLDNVVFYSGYEETKEKILKHLKTENVKKNFTGTISTVEHEFFGLPGSFKLFFSRNKLNSITFYPSKGGGLDNYKHLKATIVERSKPILSEGTEFHYSYYYPDAILILGLDPDGEILNCVLKGRKDV